MGFRFQKRISILPGMRLNLSKGGVSTSLGPRGADVNIGRDGVTTTAGIPGTGLSYRQKMGSGKGGLLGILAVVGGLAFWGFQHMDKIEKAVTPALAPATAQAPSSNPASPAGTAPALRYVRRAGSDLRDEAKTSGHVLKKESKGTQVILLSGADGWSQVRDGDITGWMRSSVLGSEQP